MNKNAKHIVQVLRENGHEAVFAGGCVRDFLLGIKPKDIDIATSAKPNDIEKLFSSTVPVGEQFGVIIVNHGGEAFEVATFREDSKESDGRRPNSVSFSNMEADAKRRDLTINALFFDPITEKVIDVIDGKKDIDNGIIRFVGNPDERIREDKLRILRAIRFGAGLGFDFDKETEEALLRNAHCVMGNVSVERIKNEIEKMLFLKKPSFAFNALYRFGILKYILPEISELYNSPQSKKWHSEGSVFKHTMMVVDNVRNRVKDPITLWAALFHDVAKPHTIEVKDDGSISNHGHEVIGVQVFEEFARRFKFSGFERKAISFLIKNHMKPNVAPKMRKSNLRKLIAEEFFFELMVLCEADNESAFPQDKEREDFKKDGIEFLKKFSSEQPKELPKPFITGKDLIDIGIKPGPIFKSLLNCMFDMQLQGEVNSHSEAISIVKKVL